MTLNAQEIEWLSWDEAFDRSNSEKKKFVVDIYTDWCGWCKKMDKTTFSNPEIAEYVNANYHAIRLNAQHVDPIEYQGKVYKYEKGIKSGYHQLAAELCKSRLKLPTVVFLDENGEVLQAIRGFQDKNTFEMIISFFAENQFKSTPWKQYVMEYRRRKMSSPGNLPSDSSHTRMVSNNNKK